MGATETGHKPTIRVLQATGSVELFVGGRQVDLRTRDGRHVDGIWIGKLAEGTDVLAESQAMKEARRKGLTLWGNTYIQGGRRELGEEFDDEITPSEVLQRYLSTRQVGEDDLSLGQQITEAFVEGKLMRDPHEIAAELDAERRVEVLVEAARNNLDRTVHHSTRSALPTRIETMNGSVSRDALQDLFNGSYMAFIRDTYTS